MKKPMSIRTLVLVIANVLMLVASLFAHITSNMIPFVIGIFGLLTVVGTAIALTLWDKIPRLRTFIRVAMLAIVGLIVVFGVVLAIATHVDNPAATAGYITEVFMALVFQVLQAFTVFMLPVLAAAGRTNLRFDNVMLFAGGVLNALAVTFMMLVSVPEGHMLFEYEIPQVMNAYTLIAWVIAAVNMIPLLSQMVKRRKAPDQAE